MKRTWRSNSISTSCPQEQRVFSWVCTRFTCSHTPEQCKNKGKMWLQPEHSWVRDNTLRKRQKNERRVKKAGIPLKTAETHQHPFHISFPHIRNVAWQMSSTSRETSFSILPPQLITEGRENNQMSHWKSARLGQTHHCTRHRKPNHCQLHSHICPGVGSPCSSCSFHYHCQAVWILQETHLHTHHQTLSLKCTQQILSVLTKTLHWETLKI